MSSSGTMADRPAGGAAGRYRFHLTPFGAGLFSLCFPGVVIAVASHQVILLAITIGAGLLLVTDAVVGRWLLSLVRVSASGPTSATPGRPVDLSVELQADRSVELDLEVPRVLSLQPALAPGRGRVTVSPERRGVVDRLLVRIGTDAPLGLVAVARAVTTVLARPLHVGQVADPVPLLPVPATVGHRPAGTGEPIGLRPYAVGDSPREVHWPAVARTGTLLVRDRRSDGRAGQVEVVVSPGDPSIVDQLAGWTSSVVDQLLAAGCRVVLTTVEPVVVEGRRLGGSSGADPSGADTSGSHRLRWVRAPVMTRDELISRMARMAPGHPADDRPGGPGVAAGGAASMLMIDDGGTRWSAGT
jgi:hypothetical protein